MLNKFILIFILLFVIACEPDPTAGQCYEHKQSPNKGLIKNIRRGDSSDVNNPIIIGSENYDEVCITRENEYDNNSKCIHLVKMGPYKREYYYSEVYIIPCTDIIKPETQHAK